MKKSQRTKRSESELAAYAQGDDVLAEGAFTLLVDVGATELIAGADIGALAALNLDAAAYAEGEAIEAVAVHLVDFELTKGVTGLASYRQEDVINQFDVQIVTTHDRNLPDLDIVGRDGLIAHFIAYADVELMAESALGIVVQVEAAAHTIGVDHIVIADRVESINGIHRLHVVGGQSAGLGSGQVIRSRRCRAGKNSQNACK